MADNFLQFSAEIPKLNDEERAWAKAHLDLFGDEAPQEGDKNYEEFTELIGVYELDCDDDTLGFDWQVDNDLWIYGELSGNPDHVAAFVQMFLKKFRPEDAFAMSWSTTCSKMRIDEFGGGAIFVTADKVEWMNAWTWCDNKWKEFRGKKEVLDQIGGGK